MRKLNGREWKSLFLFSVVVPVGLLATFRLTGILKEPATISETMIAETVKWECDRPRMGVYLSDRIESTFANDEASISLDIYIRQYLENIPGIPYYGGDGLDLWCLINATVKSGFTALITLKLQPADPEASISIKYSQSIFTSDNATIRFLKNVGTIAKEAYIIAEMTNSPCSIGDPADWIFYDKNYKNHILNMTLEFTYRTDDAYKKIVLPAMLEMTPDVGNTVDSALNASSGEYRGCIDNVDTRDVYAILLQAGQTVNITMTPPKDADYDLYFYDSNGNVVKSSESHGNVVESIVYTAETSGTWYTKVKQKEWYGHDNTGIYTLNIGLKNS